MSRPDFKTIVVLALSPLGDTLFSTPAIRALRENFPQARILILANLSAAKVLKSNPYGMEVSISSDQWDFFKILASVHKTRYDLALGLSQLGSLFTRFCGTAFHRDFYDVDCQQKQSVVQMCLEIIQTAGCEPGSSHTEFWMHEWEETEATQAVHRFFEKMKYHGAPLVAVHCGGHYFIRKRWPLTNFVKLAGWLQTRADRQVVLVGGREDIENSLIIRDAVPGVLNTVGRFTLEETAVLLKNCRLFIGNDSGPLHLAAAVKTPTIGLFGPTAPSQFYPYHPPSHTFIGKFLPCSPCYKFGGGLWQQIPKCSRAYCMEAITLKEVVLEVERKLNQPSINLLINW